MKVETVTCDKCGAVSSTPYQMSPLSVYGSVSLDEYRDKEAWWEREYDLCGKCLNEVDVAIVALVGAEGKYRTGGSS